MRQKQVDQEFKVILGYIESSTLVRYMRPVSKKQEKYNLPQLTQLRGRTQVTLLLPYSYCWPAGLLALAQSTATDLKWISTRDLCTNSSRCGPCGSPAVGRAFLRQKCSLCKRSFCDSDFYLLRSGCAAGVFPSSSILCTQPAKLEYRKLALWVPFEVSPVLVGFCLSLQRKSCPFLRQS